MNKRYAKARIDRIIGKNIANERKSRNMTRDELATLIKVSVGQVGLIERGERGVTAVNLSMLSDIFNVPIDSLFARRKKTVSGIEDCETNAQKNHRKLHALTYRLPDAEMALLIHIAKGILVLMRNEKIVKY